MQYVNKRGQQISTNFNFHFRHYIDNMQTINRYCIKRVDFGFKKISLSLTSTSSNAHRKNSNKAGKHCCEMVKPCENNVWPKFHGKNRKFVWPGGKNRTFIRPACDFLNFFFFDNCKINYLIAIDGK